MSSINFDDINISHPFFFKLVMNILGITLFTHDSSATLIKGEKIVGCCEEERFSREKADLFHHLKVC